MKFGSFVSLGNGSTRIFCCGQFTESVEQNSNNNNHNHILLTMKSYGYLIIIKNPFNKNFHMKSEL